MKDTVNQKMIFKKNMEMLKKKYPNLEKKIHQTKINNFECVMSRKPRVPSFLNKSTNMVFHDINDPIRDAEINVDALKLNNVRIALFLGFGFGYEVFYFIKNYAKNNRTMGILIVEESLEIFKMALMVVDITALLNDQNIEFIVGENGEQLDFRINEVLMKRNWFAYLKALKPIYHISAIKLSKEYYLDVIKRIKDYTTFQLNLYGNSPTDSLVGIGQMLDNIDEIIENPGISDLLGKFKDKPAIMVSAGPSLNKNKELLKGIEDNALIIAVDSAFPILMQMGVKPHLVVSLERTITTLKHMEGYEEDEVKDVFYAAVPVIRNEVYKEYKGPKIIVYRDIAQFEWLEMEKGTVHINRSSGNMAYKLASVLNCSPILIIGQDLAFSRDGRTHASGTAHGEKGERYDVFYSLGKRMIMANDGMPIETSEIWFDFLQGFEMDVESNDGVTINCTEGGAYIRGTEVMTFKDAIDKYLTKPIYPVNMIRNNLVIPNVDNKRHETDKIFKKISNAICDLTDIEKKCKEALLIYDENRRDYEVFLSKDKSQKDYDKLKKLMVELFEKRELLTEKNDTFNKIFMLVAQSFHIKFEIDTNSIPNKYLSFEDAIPEVLLSYNIWYKTIGDLASILKSSLETSLKNIEEITNE